MSSIPLHSQLFRPAEPSAGGFAARGLADATTRLAAQLRGVIRATARHLNRMRQDDAAVELRALAQSHQSTNASFAADLLAAAQQHPAIVERA